MDTKNGKGKRVLKDLTLRETHDISGGSLCSFFVDVKLAAAAAAPPPVGSPPISLKSFDAALGLL
jgi:hypothetical protein